MTIKGSYPSKHGLKAGISKDDQWVARGGVVAGGNDKPSIVFPAPDTVAVFEDFTGPGNQATDTGIPIYGGHFKRLAGDTGHHAAFVAGTNGVFRLFSTPSVGAAKAAAAGQGIGGALQWKANQGPGAHSGRLRFGARIKLEEVTRTVKRVHCFAGFTDVATFEYPAFDTGAGVIAAANDLVGFMFSPGGDTGWSGVAKAASGTPQVVALNPSVPAQNAWSVIEVELSRGTSDTGGSATFYVNGVPKGRIASPIAWDVALSPVIVGFQQDTGMEYIDIDWVNVPAPRDTGL